MNLLSNEQILINDPGQSTKYRKKELFTFYVDNKAHEIIGD